MRFDYRIAFSCDLFSVLFRTFEICFFVIKLENYNFISVKNAFN